MSGKIRLGCVKYLNAAPLIYPLENGFIAHPFEISRDVPSMLLAKLKAGEIDIALLSTAALLELNYDYSFIPGIGICSDGPVRSVSLFYNGELERIKRIKLDPSSRTGNALVKIIINHLGLKPQYLPGEEFTFPLKLDDGSGQLLIGDPALMSLNSGYNMLDLGSAWKEMTGFPFVYAMWIGRNEFITTENMIILNNAMLIGRSMINQVIAGFGNLPVNAELAKEYLSQNIIHCISDDAMAGLDLFLQKAEEFV